MIAGWQLASHMRTGLVVDALGMALGTRQRLGHVELVHHSDRGSRPGGPRCIRVAAEPGSFRDCLDVIGCDIVAGHGIFRRRIAAALA